MASKILLHTYTSLSHDSQKFSSIKLPETKNQIIKPTNEWIFSGLSQYLFMRCIGFRRCPFSILAINFQNIRSISFDSFVTQNLCLIKCVLFLFNQKFSVYFFFFGSIGFLFIQLIDSLDQFFLNAKNSSERSETPECTPKHENITLYIHCVWRTELDWIQSENILCTFFSPNIIVLVLSFTVSVFENMCVAKRASERAEYYRCEARSSRTHSHITREGEGSNSSSHGHSHSSTSKQRERKRSRNTVNGPKGAAGGNEMQQWRCKQERHIKHTPYMYRQNVYTHTQHIQHGAITQSERMKQRRENRHEKIWYKVGIIMKVLSSCTICVPHNTGALSRASTFVVAAVTVVVVDECCFFLFHSFLCRCSCSLHVYTVLFGPRDTNQKERISHPYPNTIKVLNGSANGSKISYRTKARATNRFASILSVHSINSYIGEWFNYHCVWGCVLTILSSNANIHRIFGELNAFILCINRMDCVLWYTPQSVHTSHARFSFLSLSLARSLALTPFLHNEQWNKIVRGTFTLFAAVPTLCECVHWMLCRCCCCIFFSRIIFLWYLSNAFSFNLSLVWSLLRSLNWLFAAVGLVLFALRWLAGWLARSL